MNKRVILASGSANRKRVMDSLNIPYDIIPADIDEKAIRDEDLAVRAEMIARTKAEKVAKDNDGIIIAADSFASNNGEVFEKPATIEEAKQMLQDESGGQGRLYAGFCYLDKENNIDFSTTSVVDFTLRTFSKSEIEIYVKKFPVLTWSGALFPGEVYCSGMIEKVNGSFTAYIYGLPIDLLIPLLEKSGFTPLP